MTNISQIDFDNLSNLADELAEKWISDEHWIETRILLKERESESKKVSKLIEMSQDKFNKSFDI